MEFHKRTLAGPETLGQRLRQLREEAGLTVTDVSRQLNIAAKYLTAIEEGRYNDLPGKVYASNFVRLYVARMGLNEGVAMERFVKEYELSSAARPSRRPILVQRAKTDAPWAQRNSRIIIAALAIAVVAAYFGWQIYRLYTPPPLTVTQPAKDMATSNSSLTIAGQTEPGAKVFINRQEIEVNPQGLFSEKIDLNPGLNTLEISAKKPRSKPRVIIRQILLEGQRAVSAV